MELLRRTNHFMDKWIYLIMPFIMTLGMLTGKGLVEWTGWIPFLFMLLTFLSSINADCRKFVRLVKQPVLLLTFMIAAHLIIPWIVFQMSSRFFPTHEDLAAGITLTTLLPLGVTSIFWVAYNKANVETTLSLVSIDTLLSPLIVPLTLSFILGSQVSLHMEDLIVSLLKLVLFPTLLGLLFGQYWKRREEQTWFKPSSSLLGKVCLYFIVLLNAASISEQVNMIKDHFIALIILIFCTMLFGYLANFGLSKFFTNHHEENVAISYSGGVRNYTVGVVMATAFFEPIVALPVLMAMLLQHPVALLFFYLFRFLNKKEQLSV